jgi:two-component sensor histidine kinase
MVPPFQGTTMPHPEPWLATTPNVESDDPAEGGDRLLFERARLGLHLIRAGIAVVFVGWIVMNPGEHPRLSVIQAGNFVAVALALALLRDPTRSTFNHVVTFCAYASTIVATAAVGVIAGDAMTAVFILVGMAVISAAMVPTDAWWQIAAVGLTVAAAIWAVATVNPSPPFFWLQNVGAIAPTLIATVFMSRTLRRQRAEAARAERDRRSREAGLREANRRLEQEIQEHRRTEETLRFTTRELDHRVKNTLATVQSVADQTLHSSATMREFADAFSGRLQAMARIHSALAQRRWEGLPLTDLVELVVGPYRHHPESVSIACDGTFVASELARVLGMVLHELATNAAKFGALSTAQGQVAITSHLATPAARLHISWHERGGPAVGEPARRGFGMRLIEEALAYEVDGNVALRFAGEGLRCDIEIPAPAPV